MLSNRKEAEMLIGRLELLYQDFYYLIQDFGTGVIGKTPKGDILQKIGFSITHRLAINCMSVCKTVKLLKEDDWQFLPIALVSRCIVSDILNYWYLKEIHKAIGDKGLINEDLVLQAEFAYSLKEILVMEASLVGAPGAEQRTKEVFKSNFSDLIDAIEPEIKIKDKRAIREKEHHEYFHNLPGAAFSPMLSEKFKSSVGNKPDLYMVFKYLSQIHHFSTLSDRFYTQEQFLIRNTLMLLSILGHSGKVMKDIIENFGSNTEYLRQMNDIIALSEKEMESVI